MVIVTSEERKNETLFDVLVINGEQIGDIEEGEYVIATVASLPALYRECEKPSLMIAPNGNGFMMFKLKVDGLDLIVDVQFSFDLIDINGQYNHIESTVTERGIA